jgi:imidazolonepropionase-like amidohydrolase
VSERTAQPSGKTPLAITHVTVIDCSGAATRPDSTVLIVGSDIAAVGPSDDVRTPAGGRVVDGRDRFLIPGLWDMHGHLTYATEDALALLVMNGVTGVRDLGGDLALIDRWRSEIEDGRRAGPRIVRAGPFVDGPKEGVADRLTVTAPDEARRAIRELKASGVDFIKVHNALPRESFFALMEEAGAQHIPVAVHLPMGVSSAEASDAGAASLEHIETINESAIWQPAASVTTIEEAVDANLGQAGQDLFQRLARNRTWYVPTLVTYERGFVLWSQGPEALRARLDVHHKQIELVRMMHSAGVQIMAGSDFADWGTVAGVDLHNELALLVEAGFTPLEALQAATLNPAKFLGLSNSLGTIEQGKAADLVLLDADPLENISHTRKINAVVRNGTFYPLAGARAQALLDAG